MEIIITSLITFVSTNIDDIFILALFYGDKKYKNKEIVTGQLLGMSALIVISIVGSLIGLFIDKGIIGLLGLFPIYLGVKGLWSLLNRKQKEETEQKSESAGNGVFTIAGITIANGGDNIGIYIPLFATLSIPDKTIMILVFLAMTISWCMIAKYLTKHPAVAKVVEKYGHLFTPFILIILGLFILYESGTFEMLAKVW